MPSRADAQARRMRAFNMADRMHQMGNYPAEKVWLAEADKYTDMIAAMDAHPAGKQRAPRPGTEKHSAEFPRLDK